MNQNYPLRAGYHLEDKKLIIIKKELKEFLFFRPKKAPGMGLDFFVFPVLMISANYKIKKEILCL